MQRLAGAHELLDGPLDARALEGNLRDLGRVNAVLGGASLSWRAIQPFLHTTRHRPVRLIDVGTGAADIPRDLLGRASRAGASLEVLATDVRPEIVDVARNTSQTVPGLTIDLASSDGIAAADGSFDIGHASLVLHHLEPDQARRLLAELARVSRTAVVINDLTRAAAWFAGAWLLSRIATANRYTRHDAPLSVRRAYTEREIVALAADAGLRPIARYRALPPYRCALVFVRRPSLG